MLGSELQTDWLTRAPASTNVATIFREVSRETIQVTEIGKTRRIPKIEAMLIQLVNKAVSENLQAAKEVMSWDRIFEDNDTQREAERAD